MNTDDYANIVLFAATFRKEGGFEKFRTFFNLSPPDADAVYEIFESKPGRIVHEKKTFEGATKCLDANPNFRFDFYLRDPNDSIFTFSYGPPGYQVMSIPYGLLTVDEIKVFIKEFDILYAWGTGEDSPPPDSIEEIKLASSSQISPFVRYRDGKILFGEDLIE